MSHWQTIDVHYSNPGALVLDGIVPLVRSVEDRLKHRSIERRYAGGAHIRLRLRGVDGDEDTRETTETLRRGLAGFVRRRPSPSREEEYCEDRVRVLLERENEPVPEDLSYRNNTVVVNDGLPKANLEPEAVLMLEDFRHDVFDLAVRLLREPESLHQRLLELFFFQPVVLGRGDPIRTSVSWKSHWEGFAATFPVARVIDRVRAHYEENRDVVRATLRDVETRYRDGSFAEHPVLGPWHRLLVDYRSRVDEVLERGEQITRQPSTPQEARDFRSQLFDMIERDSDFVRTLWSDERFVATTGYESSFQGPRVVTNLLYLLVTLVGLSPIDKMLLCHHAHRSVEEEHDVDLTDVLRHTMQTLIARHAHHFSPEETA